jgi:hypothetical protein
MKNAPWNRRGNSGQVLVITSLVVVMLLLSTVIYVRETEENAPVYEAEAGLNFSAIKQALMHTVMSALVNISNGGNTAVLAADLNQFKSVVVGHSYNSIFSMEYDSLNDVSYQNGLWISWGSSGEGISSACVAFMLNSSGPSTNYNSEYALNVTSSITINGYSASLNSSVKQVNVTCTVFNEGQLALARNFEVYYEQDTPLGWMQAESVGSIDFGNGTYLLSFNAQNVNQNNPPIVSVYCQDTRGISVWANATCT